MAPIFFCPHCWHELKRNVVICPYCGEAPIDWTNKTYADKLYQAPSHPDAQTQRRAVYLLGEKQVEEAVDTIEALFHQTRDPILAGEIVKALGKIRTGRAFSALIKALSLPSFIVRRKGVWLRTTRKFWHTSSR